MHELTKVRAALAGVEDPREVLEALFAHSPMACLIYDSQGRCVLANAAVASLFGAAPPPGYNVLEDESLLAKGVAGALRRVLGGETLELPVTWYDPRDVARATGPAGRRTAVAVTGFPLRGSDGVIRHFAVLARDATAELRAREELDKFERFRSSGILGVFEILARGAARGRGQRCVPRDARLFPRRPPRRSHQDRGAEPSRVPRR